MEYTLRMIRKSKFERITELKLSEEVVLQFCKKANITLEYFLDNVVQFTGCEEEHMGNIVSEKFYDIEDGFSAEISKG